jgi:hypothetical protein
MRQYTLFILSKNRRYSTNTEVKLRNIFFFFCYLGLGNLFFILVSGACSRSFFYEDVGTAATPGLLCQPRVILKMIVKQMECKLAGETEIVGENLPQRHFCPSQNPT